MTSHRATGYSRSPRFNRELSRAMPHVLALLIAGMGLRPAYGVGTITINSGNSFGGTAAVNSSIVVNGGGILTPGIVSLNNGVGTLPFSGTNSLTMNANSVLNLDFSTTPANDMITLAGGSLTLAGPINVNVFQAGTNVPFTGTGTYNIFSFASAGNFFGSASSLDVVNNTSSATSYSFSLVDNGTNGPSAIVLQISPIVSAFIWNGVAGDADWGNAGNWVANAVPGVTGDAVTFGSASSSAGLVNLNAPRHVGSLTLDNANGYTLASGASGKLFLDNATSTAVVSVVTGSHLISADVQLTSNAAISFASSSNMLTLAGVVSSGSANANASLSITGPGKLLVTGEDTYSGPTSIGSGATLQIGNGGTQGNLASALILNNGSLALNRADAFTISGSLVGNGALLQTGGTVTLSGSGNALTGSTVVNVGTLIFGGAAAHSVAGISGTGKVLVAGGASVTSDGLQVNAWSISGSHTIRSNGSASGTSAVSSFTIAGAPVSAGGWTGKLDLTNNALIVLNADSASKATTLLNLTDQVASGKNGGTWNGTGITSSSVALNANTTLAVVDDGELGAASFHGVVGLDANSVIVTQALLGDVDLNGVVDFGDLLKISQDFGEPNTVGWAAGNLDGSNGVDFGDLLLVAQHFGQTLQVLPGGGDAVASGGVSGAPEPASLTLLALGGAALLTRGRRR